MTFQAYVTDRIDCHGTSSDKTLRFPFDRDKTWRWHSKIPYLKIVKTCF
jgi:hypothetical protein